MYILHPILLAYWCKIYMASQPTPLLAYPPERKKDFIVCLIKGTATVFVNPDHKPGHLRKIEER